MARRIALLAALAPLVLPAVAGAATPARFFAGTPIDGPSADIQALGDLDVARDGTGAPRRTSSAWRGSTTSSSRGWPAAASSAPEQVDAGLAGAGSQPVVAASDGGRLVVAFVSGGTVFAAVRPAGAPGYAALQPIADAGSNPDVEMSINGVGLSRVVLQRRRAGRAAGAQRDGVQRRAGPAGHRSGRDRRRRAPAGRR